ncbi:MAG: cytochrome d ubiquinol oxidase subunit II [Desulfovibrio sp.]|nr:cytochrome d ubiquinol oxidase subunit II [Desulfovibrio sp.]
MLETIWFILWAVLWGMFFILDGFDLGVGTLLPVLAKNEDERRIMYNVAGPFWDGNEVWLIAAGGVTFAAFPKAYAVMFSALYVPLLLLLFTLIFRAVSFEFRNKVAHASWRVLWDSIHFFSNIAASVLLGVAFANLFMGIPVDAQGVYHGNLLSLLNPYGLAGGVFFLCMFILHGALWLAIKSRDDLQTRAVATAFFIWPVMLVLLLAFLVLTAMHTNLFANYLAMPALFILPILALAGLILVRIMLREGRLWAAWGSSALFIFSVTFFGVAGMFPGMIISSLDPAATGTAFNGASSPLTLKIMLGVALVMVPIVLAYQCWTYHVFSAPVTREDLEDDHAY